MAGTLFNAIKYILFTNDMSCYCKIDWSQGCHTKHQGRVVMTDDIDAMYCYCCTFCLFQDALGTLGGVQVLFPLLETVDVPIEPYHEPVVQIDGRDVIHRNTNAIDSDVGTLGNGECGDEVSHLAATASPVSPVAAPEQQTREESLISNETVTDGIDSTNGTEQLHWKPPSGSILSFEL